MTRPTRPVPVADEQSAPFWQAAKEHVLSIARCRKCASFTHPPDVVCPHCGSSAPEFTFTAVSGNGAVRAWVVMHQSFLPGFDADLPFVLVDVELAEQRELRLIGRLLDGVHAPLHVGAAVRVAFEDVLPGVSIPAFVLEASK